ncbi:flagellar biosynthetic protein FliQ [Fretibacter rubidus]|uniref:flagellar biosynthetic protein FliQ n=1 Tax=Fretibacter rubidus TaxID=570162 RepID=UPI00352A147B
MGTDQAVYLLSQMVWNALIVAAPILLATLFVGLLISIFQVTTQLQEITLSYVPKILVTAFLLIGLGPWMIGRIGSFATSLYQIIPGLS